MTLVVVVFTPSIMLESTIVVSGFLHGDHDIGFFPFHFSC
jgi:hypothetical protein